jgi:hypothetical protein
MLQTIQNHRTVAVTDGAKSMRTLQQEVPMTFCSPSAKVSEKSP